ncbi:MAG: ATP-binding cassette domain-containing protein [Candidatus Dojkabacteria bacterium]
MKNIIIKGAKENNLKNITVEFPRGKIICFVGVSGSGKSSLAYNILYSEGQRQFLESVNTFAARLLKRTQRPDVDSIENLSPTISIDQKRLRGNPRSTVGTATELYTYLRLLFSRFGSIHDLSAGHFSFNNPKGACPKCKGLGIEFTMKPEEIADFSKSLSEGAINHNNYKPDSRMYNIIATSKKLDMNKKLSDYSQEELDFLLYSPRIELSNKDNGFIQRFSHEGIITRLKNRAGDLRGGSERKEKTDKPYISQQVCSLCNGGRLNQKALESKINGQNIGYYVNLEIDSFIEEIKNLDIPDAKDLIERILEMAQHLVTVKLHYLSLNRSLETLSGGEAQRLKLARELGNDLIEMVYILDEPTSGLHSYDKENLIKIIKDLNQKGNTIIVIEHDGEMIKSSDYVLELGPKAGKQGGDVVFSGTYDEFLKSGDTITVPYLLGKSEINIKERRIPKEFLPIENANEHNLKNVTCNIPVGVLCTFTGVSGSGKSTLLMDVFAKKYKDKVIIVDQKQMQGTVRGNTATYVGVFDKIRDLFASKNEVSKSLFSFNSEGSCPDCKGVGYKKIDMHFMGDVTVKCDTCNGKRYKDFVLEYKFNGKNISEILEMTVKEAYEFFEDSEIKKSFETLIKVGLEYIELGQSHDTFSGGEAQRLKLASQLDRTGEIYILDEPTSGLHYSDIEHLMKLINEIVERGNTVLAIEHNIEFIKQSDWVIDLGPGGGDEGGEIVAQGVPEDIAKVKNSYTGKYLNL